MPRSLQQMMEGLRRQAQGLDTNNKAVKAMILNEKLCLDEKECPTE